MRDTAVATLDAETPPESFGALLSVASLARYIDCSPRLVWQLVAAGNLPAPISPPGTRRRLWRRDEVDEAIADWK